MANPQVRRKIQIQPRGMVLALLHRLKLSPPHFWMHLVIGHTIDGIWFVISIYDYTWLYMILSCFAIYVLFFQHWYALIASWTATLEKSWKHTRQVPHSPTIATHDLLTKRTSPTSPCQAGVVIDIAKVQLWPKQNDDPRKCFPEPPRTLDGRLGRAGATSRSRSGKPESSWRCIISSAICTKPGTFATALIHICVPYKRAGTRTDYYCQARGQRNTLKPPHTVRLLLGNKGRF